MKMPLGVFSLLMLLIFVLILSAGVATGFFLSKIINSNTNNFGRAHKCIVIYIIPLFLFYLLTRFMVGAISWAPNKIVFSSLHQIFWLIWFFFVSMIASFLLRTLVAYNCNNLLYLISAVYAILLLFLAITLIIPFTVGEVGTGELVPFFAEWE